MLRKTLLFIFTAFISFSTVFAQSGKLSGKIIDAETNEAIPFANIVALQNGVQKGGSTSDFDGKYMITPLSPGEYDVVVSVVGYAKKTIQGVIINFETTTRLDIKITSTTEMLEEVVIYDKPLIEIDQTSTGAKLTAKEIELLPTRNINAIVNTTGGVFSSDDGEAVIIAGTRSGATQYHLNGVKLFDTPVVPKTALADLTIIRSGIPAQYGDLLGGVISMTTKTPTSKITGNIEAETSMLFDKWRYNLLGASLSGPILTTRDTTSLDNKRSLLGFFVAAQYSGARDPDPSAIGIWKVKDDVLERIEKKPLIKKDVGFNYAAESITRDDLEKIKYKQNTGDYGTSINSLIDFSPTNDINIKLGGNFQYSKRHDFIWGYSLFNPDNNPERISNSFQVYVNFTQKFPGLSGDSAKSLIKNVFYTVQADFTKSKFVQQDDSHEDRYFNYGYIGKFTQKSNPTYTSNLLGGPGVPLDSLLLDDGTLLYGKIEEDQGDLNTELLFEAGSVNPLAANYSQQVYDESDLMIESPGDLLGNLGLINGERSKFVNSLWYGVGREFNGYTVADNSQFRFTGRVVADVGSHAVKLGFEYEQRAASGFFVSPLDLWNVGRGLLNKHIKPNDPSNFTIRSEIDANGDTLTFVDYHSILDTTNEQTTFDKNLRDQLGLSLLEPINIDELSPDQLSLGLFSADELVTQGLVSYTGYSHTGKKLKKRVAFEDFFKDEMNRPQDAFRPVYTAFFVEDKFEIEDLIVRLGLRVDRYDANTKVLRDKYSLVKLRSVEETNMSLFNQKTYVKPSVVGEDWAVYVSQTSDDYDGTDQSQANYDVVGYRDGDVWYDKGGAEILSPRELEVSGVIFPWYDLVNDNQNYYQEAKLSLEAFEDYKPVITPMPRISFSFPVSEEAGFFASYDILSQRPGFSRNSALASSYFFLNQRQSTFITNPNMRPQRKISYMIGFKQKISDRSALTISTFYDELRDMLHIIELPGAYPKPYLTLDNLDWGTVKGFIFDYDLRRTKNFEIDASYTLQFAEGTATSQSSGVSFVDIANLKTPVPLDFDNRHAFKLNLSYGFKDDEGPVLFDKKIFQNSVASFSMVTRSGTPYTKQSNITKNATIGEPIRSILLGQVNGARLPWLFAANLGIDKSFTFQKEGGKKTSLTVFMYVRNLFNNLNVPSNPDRNGGGVYRKTGAPDDDGYLATINREDDPSLYDLYAIKVANPHNYTLPRRIRIGLEYSF